MDFEKTINFQLAIIYIMLFLLTISLMFMYQVEKENIKIIKETIKLLPEEERLSLFNNSSIGKLNIENKKGDIQWNANKK